MWSIFFQKIWGVTFSRTVSYLWVRSNSSRLHNFLWITFPTQLGLHLYSSYYNWLHSLIIWLTALSLSLSLSLSLTLSLYLSIYQHSHNLVFYWVLTILAFTWLVLMVLFWAPFLSSGFLTETMSMLSQRQSHFVFWNIQKCLSKCSLYFYQ